jgi:hypothetical protein
MNLAIHDLNHVAARATFGICWIQVIGLAPVIMRVLAQVQRLEPCVEIPCMVHNAISPARGGG